MMPKVMSCTLTSLGNRLAVMYKPGTKAPILVKMSKDRETYKTFGYFKDRECAESFCIDIGEDKDD